MKSNKQSQLARDLKSDAFIVKVAERFKMLGEPMRLKLIQSLMSGERTVGELVQSTGAAQANVSRHLNHLTQVGLLGRRKAGLHVYYHIEDESIYGLCELVCGSVRAQAKAELEALN